MTLWLMIQFVVLLLALLFLFVGISAIIKKKYAKGILFVFLPAFFVVLFVYADPALSIPAILWAVALLILFVGIYSILNKKYIKGGMFVLPAILLIILTLYAVPFLFQTRACSEIESPKASLRGVQSALELYFRHYKMYPEKLEIAIKEGYLQEGGDKDPWNNHYKYERTPDKSNYHLGSAGEDKIFDTEDDVEPPINTLAHTYKKNIQVKK